MLRAMNCLTGNRAKSAHAASMAAVLCLIMLPVIAGIGFMVGANVGGAAGAGLAVIAFILLGSGLVIGLSRIAKGWDGD